MKKSVSAVFVSQDCVYFIKRQNFLPVFPGYYGTPGGKVEENDRNDRPWFKSDDRIDNKIYNALIREVKEELGFDLISEHRSIVLSIDYIGMAITPEFNPYRFENYYFLIELTEKFNFKLDLNEAEFGEWIRPKDLISKFNNGGILAVPPAILLLKRLAENINSKEVINLNLDFEPSINVPSIESLKGVRQLLPMSNTFPPANRTNSFIIGDDGFDKFLIDPSPKNEEELQKFIHTIDKIRFNKILITHHHPDHYEYANFIAKKYNCPIYLSEYTYKKIGIGYFDGIVVNFLKEGDIITKSIGEDVVVYEVPGHDEGQIGLAPKNLNWFLVGDLIQTIGTVAILPPEGDMKKYFDTLSRIIEMRPKNIIPSHGIIVGGVEKLCETLNHRKAREEEIKNLLKKNYTIDQIVENIYPDLALNLVSYAKRTVLAHLKKIEEEA